MANRLTALWLDSDLNGKSFNRAQVDSDLNVKSINRALAG